MKISRLLSSIVSDHFTPTAFATAWNHKYKVAFAIRECARVFIRTFIEKNKGKETNAKVQRVAQKNIEAEEKNWKKGIKGEQILNRMREGETEREQQMTKRRSWESSRTVADRTEY